ncbi:DUF6286 domain-containing Asp23/Gls24 family envelope stress response protein [Prescottella sp. R16]|uniref:DUF6286 domain-containing Asp23/Gls24 family envelope stress response protein n=1 Tax=Prescottella sp. R16 TaxID=3064529 RepID=UPI00272E22F7|nr:DUF6286 domain-containing Asp23/Gls24 family envelope stress response protein [Prescottella sp. R16]
MADDPGDRGRLVVKDRAIAKIATTTALQVPGVVPHGSSLTRFTGRDLPRADISAGSHSVAVNLYLGVQWPCDVAELTRRVHGDVAERVEHLAGLPLHRLGVYVAGTVPTPSDDATTGPAPVASETVVAPRPPTAAPAAVPAAVVLAVGLLALAGAVGRELLIVRGTISGAPWIRNSVEWVARLHWEQWLLPAALAALTVGVLLVLLALAPRTRTHVPTRRRPSDSASTVWLRPVDIARLCSARAGTLAGVHTAHTTVDRRRANVHVTTVPDGSPPGLEAAVADAVTDTLTVLDRPLRVKVTTRRARSTP